MNEENIDLMPYKDRQQELMAQVSEMQEKLHALQGELDEYNVICRQELITLILQGKTTGDALQDEAILSVGSDFEIISNVLAINKKIMAFAGREILIRFSYQKKVLFQRIGGGNRDSVQVTEYVLGTLSGERLQLAKGARPASFDFPVVIPFTQYVTIPSPHMFGIKDGDGLTLHEGPLALEYMLLRALTFHIMGTSVDDGVNVHIFYSEDQASEVCHQYSRALMLLREGKKPEAPV